MSSLTNFILESGIPKETMIYILMLPIIATIVALIRQLIGFKTFGIYIPSILTIIFISTGIVPGLIVFLAVLISGFFAKWFFSKIRLLYLPRMALMLTLVSIMILIVLSVFGFAGIDSLAKISIFAVIVMIILVERFLNVQIERGTNEAVILSIETLAISIVGYFLLSWQTLQNFILTYPWVILFIVAINIFLGRWTGLRLTEYIRFKSLLNQK